jgi:hypothetical protein
MRVFTILCHGTDFNRHVENELVAEFGRFLHGSEVQVAGLATRTARTPLSGEYLILEGVGSESGPGAPMPGTVNPYTLAPKVEEPQPVTLLDAMILGLGADSDFKREFDGEGLPAPYRISGKVTGEGWDDNVQRAVGIVVNLAQSPQVINILGWSRGAVTAIKIANKLNEVFATSIQVNLFCVDPVYGGFGVSTEPDVTIIPVNVNCAVIVLALHDQRQTFAPSDLSRLHVENPMVTTAIFLPMSGTHVEVVRATSIDHSHSSKVVRHLAYRFLVKFGTRFKGGFDASMDLLDTCYCYAKMLKNTGSYDAGAKSSWMDYIMGVGYNNRDFTGQLPTYTAHSDHFINEHHRACFRQAFPRLYALLFTQGGPVVSSTTLPELRRLYVQTKQEHPLISGTLEPLFRTEFMKYVAAYHSNRISPRMLACILMLVKTGTSPKLALLNRAWPAGILPVP